MRKSLEAIVEPTRVAGLVDEDEVFVSEVETGQRNKLQSFEKPACRP